MSVLSIPRTVPVGDRRRTFTLVRLDGIAAPLPLVLAFHGSASSGSGLRKHSDGAFDRLVAEGKAIVAYLEGYKGHWNDSRIGSTFAARADSVDDLSFVQAVIDQLAAEHKADPQRVYAVGFSQGGQMVLRLLHDRPALLRGAMLIGSAMPSPDNWMSTGEPADVPVLIVAGTADKISPFEGGQTSLYGFKPRGLHLSSLGTAEYFAKARGLDATPSVSVAPQRPESGGRFVTVRQWGDGTHLVRHYAVNGGGHQIPHRGKQTGTLLLGESTQDIDAAEEFERYLLRP